MVDSEDDEDLNKTASAEDCEPPATKKLRSSDPDLKVTIQYDHGPDKRKKTYAMYAQVLARQSKFVDTMLSVEMREKETREVILHDVSPKVFELALQFLEDPTFVLSMTAEHAMKVVAFYDKYEFKEGISLCDRVLEKDIYEAYQKKGRPENLDFLVEILAASEQFRLIKSKSQAASFLFSRFWVVQEHHYGAEMFSSDHIRKLQPLLLALTKEQDFNLPFPATEDELMSPLFPKYFVEKVAHLFSRNILKVVVVCGAQSTANGKYTRQDGRRFTCDARPTSWDGRLAQCHLDRTRDGNWGIVCRYLPGGNEEVVLWKSPHSQNLECPPTEPWVPVLPRATGVVAGATPIIKYIKYEK